MMRERSCWRLHSGRRGHSKGHAPSREALRRFAAAHLAFRWRVAANRSYQRLEVRFTQLVDEIAAQYTALDPVRQDVNHAGEDRLTLARGVFEFEVQESAVLDVVGNFQADTAQRDIDDVSRASPFLRIGKQIVGRLDGGGPPGKAALLAGAGLLHARDERGQVIIL